MRWEFIRLQAKHPFLMADVLNQSGGRKLSGDIDNYAKAVLDALNGVAYNDDKQIVVLMLEKK